MTMPSGGPVTDQIRAVEESWHLSRAVPISTIIFLIAQTIALVVWGTRLDFRVTKMEADRIEHRELDNVIHAEQSRRFTALEGIVPKLSVIESKQLEVIKRLDENSAKLDKIMEEVFKRR